MSENGKPDCYKCQHRGTLSGSAHSRCQHPSIGKIDPLFEVAAILASVGRVPPIQVSAKQLNIKGNPHGIRNGWFNWPYNFDPVWLDSCDGFEAKDADKAERQTADG